METATFSLSSHLVGRSARPLVLLALAMALGGCGAAAPLTMDSLRVDPTPLALSQAKPLPQAKPIPQAEPAKKPLALSQAKLPSQAKPAKLPPQAKPQAKLAKLPSQAKPAKLAKLPPQAKPAKLAKLPPQAKPAQAKLAKAVGHALRLSPGDDLALALHHLAVRADWTLIWRNPRDYRIGAQALIKGDFIEILATVADAWDGSEHPIDIILHPANKVAIVRAGLTP